MVLKHGDNKVLDYLEWDPNYCLSSTFLLVADGLHLEETQLLLLYLSHCPSHSHSPILIFNSRQLSSFYFHEPNWCKCLGSSMVLTPAQPTHVCLRAEGGRGKNKEDGRAPRATQGWRRRQKPCLAGVYKHRNLTFSPSDGRASVFHITLFWEKRWLTRASCITHFSEFSIRNYLMTGPILITMVPAIHPGTPVAGPAAGGDPTHPACGPGGPLPIRPPGARLRELTSVLSICLILAAWWGK